jgi:thioesterase domain-containing protein
LAALPAAGDGQYVLVGYSSGGWLAHAVAAAAEQDGRAPTGVVLLDTYLPGDTAVAELQADLYRELVVKPVLTALVGERELTAMGRYLRLFDGWSPQQAEFPTLVVTADRFTENEDPAVAACRSKWPLPHSGVAVSGTHVTMIEEHANETAGAVEKWLRGLA